MSATKLREESHLVLHGGSWNRTGTRTLRADFQGGERPAHFDDCLGFRTMLPGRKART